MRRLLRRVVFWLLKLELSEVQVRVKGEHATLRRFVVTESR